MPKKIPPHIHRETTRHGKPVWCFRRGKGLRIRLRAPFGSAEFMAEYAAALSAPENDPPPKVERKRPVSVTLSRMTSDLQKRLAEASPSVPADGWVYFALAGQKMKIGYAKDVRKRVKSFQTGSCEEIRVIARVKGSMATERFYHDKFSKYRAHGEWFHYEGELAKFVSGAWRKEIQSLPDGERGLDIVL